MSALKPSELMEVYLSSRYPEARGHNQHFLDQRLSLCIYLLICPVSPRHYFITDALFTSSFERKITDQQSVQDYSTSPYVYRLPRVRLL